MSRIFTYCDSARFGAVLGGELTLSERATFVDFSIVKWTREDTKDYIYAFQELKKLSKNPGTFIIDSGDSIQKAIKIVYPNSNSMLCT